MQIRIEYTLINKALEKFNPLIQNNSTIPLYVKNIIKQPQIRNTGLCKRLDLSHAINLLSTSIDTITIVKEYSSRKNGDMLVMGTSTIFSISQAISIIVAMIT
jgi:hypothetical protein